MTKRQSNTGLSGYKLENVYFNDRERKEYEEWAKTQGKIPFDRMLTVLEGGFKISLSYEDGSSTYVVSLTAKRPVNKTLKNHVFILRHTDYAKACWLAMYFFTVLLSEGEQFPKDMSSENDW